MTHPTPTTPGPGTAALPRWLKPVNRVIVLLQGLGIAFLTFHVLSVPGRKTGRQRPTPVSPFSVEGRRYIVSFGQTEWVRNARAAGWGILGRGRRRQRVRLVELGLEEREPILRQFPVQIPAGSGSSCRWAPSSRRPILTRSRRRRQDWRCSGWSRSTRESGQVLCRNLRNADHLVVQREWACGQSAIRELRRLLLTRRMALGVASGSMCRQR
jgi:hypothetical protein